MQANVILNTDGKGLWSSEARAVRIVDMVLGVGIRYEDEEDICGELRVHFDTETWDTEADGLIYTDKQFLSELQEFLKQQGLGDDVWYSEQGMQGDDYVSLDAGTAFYRAWMQKFGVAEEELVEVW